VNINTPQFLYGLHKVGILFKRLGRFEHVQGMYQFIVFVDGRHFFLAVRESDLDSFRCLPVPLSDLELRHPRPDEYLQMSDHSELSGAVLNAWNATFNESHSIICDNNATVLSMPEFGKRLLDEGSQGLGVMLGLIFTWRQNPSVFDTALKEADNKNSAFIIHRS